MECVDELLVERCDNDDYQMITVVFGEPRYDAEVQLFGLDNAIRLDKPIWLTDNDNGGEVICANVSKLRDMPYYYGWLTLISKFMSPKEQRGVSKIERVEPSRVIATVECTKRAMACRALFGEEWFLETMAALEAAPTDQLPDILNQRVFDEFQDPTDPRIVKAVSIMAEISESDAQDFIAMGVEFIRNDWQMPEE
jgi:hypothetical protein